MGKPENAFPMQYSLTTGASSKPLTTHYKPTLASAATGGLPPVPRAESCPPGPPNFERLVKDTQSHLSYLQPGLPKSSAALDKPEFFGIKRLKADGVLSSASNGLRSEKDDLPPWVPAAAKVSFNAFSTEPRAFERDQEVVANPWMEPGLIDKFNGRWMDAEVSWMPPSRNTQPTPVKPYLECSQMDWEKNKPMSIDDVLEIGRQQAQRRQMGMLDIRENQAATIENRRADKVVNYGSAATFSRPSPSAGPGQMSPVPQPAAGSLRTGQVRTLNAIAPLLAPPAEAALGTTTPGEAPAEATVTDSLALPEGAITVHSGQAHPTSARILTLEGPGSGRGSESLDAISPVSALSGSDARVGGLRAPSSGVGSTSGTFRSQGSRKGARGARGRQKQALIPEPEEEEEEEPPEEHYVVVQVFIAFSNLPDRALLLHVSSKMTAGEAIEGILERYLEPANERWHKGRRPKSRSPSDFRLRVANAEGKCNRFYEPLRNNCPLQHQLAEFPFLLVLVAAPKHVVDSSHLSLNLKEGDLVPKAGNAPPAPPSIDAGMAQDG